LTDWVSTVSAAANRCKPGQHKQHCRSNSQHCRLQTLR